MNHSSNYQNTRGTVLATFTQTGTYSNFIDLGGGNLVALDASQWTGAAGSLFIRGMNDASGNGTGVPVVLNTVKASSGTVFSVPTFASGSIFEIDPALSQSLQYIRLQVGTAGTAGVAAGGTIILVTRV